MYILFYNNFREVLIYDGEDRGQIVETDIEAKDKSELNDVVAEKI